MRTESEIQKAHNTLGAAVKALRSVGAEGELVRKFEMHLTVLCWVLQHPGGDSFDLDMIAIHELVKGES